MRKWVRALAPLGMVSALCYLALILAGQAMWSGYDPPSTFVSYLTASGAPNAPLMQALDNAHGLFQLLFMMGMYQRAPARGGALLRRGYALLFGMATATLAGFAAFPLNALEPYDSPYNLIHFAIAVAALFASIAAILTLGAGYQKQAGQSALGRLCLWGGGLTAGFGGLTLLVMAVWPGIVGVPQRAMIFSMQGFIFALSAVYTFNPALTAIRRSGARTRA